MIPPYTCIRMMYFNWIREGIFFHKYNMFCTLPCVVFAMGDSADRVFVNKYHVTWDKPLLKIATPINVLHNFFTLLVAIHFAHLIKLRIVVFRLEKLPLPGGSGGICLPLKRYLIFWQTPLTNMIYLYKNHRICKLGNLLLVILLQS